MPRSWPKRGPKGMYTAYVKVYGDSSKWTRAALLSERLRITIRLIALEEQCQRLGAGAMPPRIMQTLRLLSDYREAMFKKHWVSRATLRSKIRVRRDRMPLEQLRTECGHATSRAPGQEPVIARLEQGDRLFDLGQSIEGVFCSLDCARPRRIVHVLEEDLHGQ